MTSVTDKSLSAYSYVDKIKGWIDIETVIPDVDVCVGIKKDGTIIYESNGWKKYDFSNWKGVVSIDICGTTVMGVKEDGTVLKTGREENR